MTASNGSEVVIVLPASFSASIGNNISFTRGTNQFTLTNNSGSTVNTNILYNKGLICHMG